MSTAEIFQIECSNLAASLAFAEKLGQSLKGREVIELVSDIGGGKTTFVKGLAKGIGSNDQVTSPTFTLSNVYDGSQLQMHHYDFYRLADAGILRDEIRDSLELSNGVTVVEWAEIVYDVLPEDRLTITITTTGEDSRQYQLHAGPGLQQLLKGL